MQFNSMEQAIEYLEVHGKTIGAKAREGDQLCADIVRWYGLHYKSQGDPGARAIVTMKLEEYAKREAEVQP